MASLAPAGEMAPSTPNRIKSATERFKTASRELADRAIDAVMNSRVATVIGWGRAGGISQSAERTPYQVYMPKSEATQVPKSLEPKPFPVSNVSQEFLDKFHVRQEIADLVETPIKLGMNDAAHRTPYDVYINGPREEPSMVRPYLLGRSRAEAAAAFIAATTPPEPEAQSAVVSEGTEDNYGRHSLKEAPDASPKNESDFGYFKEPPYDPRFATQRKFDPLTAPFDQVEARQQKPESQPQQTPVDEYPTTPLTLPENMPGYPLPKKPAEIKTDPFLKLENRPNDDPEKTDILPRIEVASSLGSERRSFRIITPESVSGQKLLTGYYDSFSRKELIPADKSGIGAKANYDQLVGESVRLLTEANLDSPAMNDDIMKCLEKASHYTAISEVLKLKDFKPEHILNAQIGALFTTTLAKDLALATRNIEMSTQADRVFAELSSPKLFTESIAHVLKVENTKPSPAALTLSYLVSNDLRILNPELINHERARSVFHQLSDRIDFASQRGGEFDPTVLRQIKIQRFQLTR